MVTPSWGLSGKSRQIPIIGPLRPVVSRPFIHCQALAVFLDSLPVAYRILLFVCVICGLSLLKVTLKECVENLRCKTVTSRKSRNQK